VRRRVQCNSSSLSQSQLGPNRGIGILQRRRPYSNVLTSKRDRASRLPPLLVCSCIYSTRSINEKPRFLYAMLREIQQLHLTSLESDASMRRGKWRGPAAEDPIAPVGRRILEGCPTDARAPPVQSAPQSARAERRSSCARPAQSEVPVVTAARLEPIGSVKAFRITVARRGHHYDRCTFGNLDPGTAGYDRALLDPASKWADLVGDRTAT
jgi:hypothetical protein